MSTPVAGRSVIRQMPDVLASKIAAGEVVQRPESVVKELVENAIDSGAGRIDILLKRSGIDRIQVIDDGSGMTEADVRMCFARHATSKITAIEDLDAIATLGFRGEAIASIGSVSRMRVRSRTPDAVSGTEARHDGGTTRFVGPCATNVGTSVTVSDLFFNVPARRKFLKSEAAELRRIVEFVQQVALSHPDIAFSLDHDGRELLTLQPHVDNDAVEAVAARTAATFGTDPEALVRVNEQTSYLSVLGVVGRPSVSRKSRGQQVFVVNGRVVKSRYLEHAVRGACGDSLKEGEHPLFVLFLDLDPGHVDVNVHPAKSEIKFDDERGVYAFVRAIVGRALASGNATPSLDHDGDGPLSAQLGWSGQSGEAGGSAHSGLWRSIPGAAGQFSQMLLGQPGSTTGGTSGVALGGTAGGNSGDTSGDTSGESAARASETLRRGGEEYLVWQIADRYLVAGLRSGLLIVDQRAAHERVIFERVLASLASGGAFTQQLLFPQTVDLTAPQYAVAEDLMGDLRRTGFDLDEFGGTTLIVRGVPAEVAVGSVDALLADIIDRFDSEAARSPVQRAERLARSIAASSAVRTNARLNQVEMRALIDQLLVCQDPALAPDGRRALLNLGEGDLRSLFGG